MQRCSRLVPRLALACCAGILTVATTTAQSPAFLVADLDGAQAVPASGSSATGWALIEANRLTGQVRIFLSTSGITASAAHLHRAPAGSAGPVVLPLAAGPGGTWTGSGPLGGTDIVALFSGDTYVNVHSAAFPSGEIRGQVEPATTEYFVAELDGTQAVPANMSAATGSGRFALHRPANIVSYDVTTSGLSMVRAAHIHDGAAGTTGPILHGLTGAAGNFCGVTAKWSASELAKLAAGDTYVNVHTPTVPSGEIRGQLRREAPHLAGAVATLSGAQEVPMNASTATGHASIRALPDGRLRYDVRVSGMTPVASHIHTAPAGSNGPVTVPLTMVGPGHFAGVSAPVSAAQLLDAATGNWYVNVHSAMFPGGEIRGQVQVATAPMPFGRGCVGTNGMDPVLTASDPLLRAQDYRMDVRRANPSSSGAIFFGFQRLASPVDLTPAGFTGCFLQPVIVSVVPLSTNTLGCGQFTLAVTDSIAAVSAGLNLINQAAVIDFGANPVGVVLTNAVESPLR